jgi:hypothetical protein
MTHFELTVKISASKSKIQDWLPRPKILVFWLFYGNRKAVILLFLKNILGILSQTLRIFGPKVAENGTKDKFRPVFLKLCRKEIENRALGNNNNGPR